MESSKYWIVGEGGGGVGWKAFNINGWIRHNGSGVDLKMGGSPYQSNFSAQKVLKKTSNLKMAVCKAVRRGCKQNPWRAPANYLVFCKAVNS